VETSSRSRRVLLLRAVGLELLVVAVLLEEAGYVATERRLDGHRRKVRARLTEAGRDAFDGHVAALHAIVDGTTASLPA